MKEYIGEKQYLFVGKAWELDQLIKERRKSKRKFKIFMVNYNSYYTVGWWNYIYDVWTTTTWFT